MNSKQELGRIIFKRLTSTFNINKGNFVIDYASNPFEVLISIILSQNTSDRNSIRAFLNLKKEIGTDPNKLANTPIDRIEKAIKVAGIYKRKARVIKELSKAVINGLNLNMILNFPVEKARAELMKLPGIGKKTADVFLALFGKRTIGVDTHAARIAKRLGLVKENSTYEDIRKTLLETFAFAKNYDYVHRLLIQLGRTFCTARKPKCHMCPLKDLCQYQQKNHP